MRYFVMSLSEGAWDAIGFVNLNLQGSVDKIAHFIEWEIQFKRTSLSVLSCCLETKFSIWEIDLKSIDWNHFLQEILL